MAETAPAEDADTAQANSQPEFSIVVRRPDQRGPLGPYRLAISIAVVMIVLGPSLYSMVMGQSPDDMVLLRAGAIGVLVWITTGIVNSALGSAAGARPQRSGGSPRS